MKGRRLLRLFPCAWRARYGDEIAHLLEESQRPVSDRVDLARSAAFARFSQAVSALASRSAVLALATGAALLLVAGGVRATLAAVTHLRHGLIELPGHWWSALAIAPLAAGTALSVLAVAALRHRRSAQ